MPIFDSAHNGLLNHVMVRKNGFITATLSDGMQLVVTTETDD